MVRLGGKSTSRTEPLTLQKQTANSKLGKTDWTIIHELKARSEHLLDRLKLNFQSYKSSGMQSGDIIEYLEFDDPNYFDAFRVPKAGDGMTRVGKKGRAVHPHYLFNQWSSGQDAGMPFRNNPHILKFSDIWRMAPPRRQALITKWRQAILKEQVANIHTIAKDYNECQSRLDRMFGEKTAAILKRKRIIGCTTTAAAKYSEDIQMASPGVLLLEEAGEVMEAHIITAMGENTQQLILIGDHKYVNIGISFLYCCRNTHFSDNSVPKSTTIS